MGFNIVEKTVKPSTAAADAFMRQRQIDGSSARLRSEVQRMLAAGRAHTTTVAKVFQLLIETDTDRFGADAVQRVLRNFDVGVAEGW